MSDAPTRRIDREQLLWLLRTNHERPLFKRVPPKRILRCDRQPLRFPHTAPPKPPPRLPVVALSFAITLGIGATLLVAFH